MLNESALRALANPDSGILENIRLAPDAFAGQSFATGLARWPELAGPPLPVSGTGPSVASARISLVMEAVERHCSVFTGAEPVVRARRGELARSEFESLLHYSAKQYATRSDAVAMDDAAWVAEELPAEAAIGWVEARSLVSGQATFVPAALVYLGYGVEDEPLYAIADTNGCAAGESMEQAIRHGLLEVVERDALVIWWYNAISRPGFSFEGDEFLARVDASLAKVGRRLQLIDLTHDLGIPVVAAYSANDSGGRIYIGCAADTCYRRAARRATAEMLQFWFWDKVAGDAPERRAWLEAETLETQPWLQPVSTRELPDEADEMEGGVIEGVTRAGFDPLLVDLTRPWIGIPVARVLVPGLRSHAPRFAPGRLFDVPVALGWISAQRSEEQLQRYTCPI